jgi:nucleotide-binding universal stress UspA family protein
MITISRILHPTDLSKNSRAALRYASDLARHYHADLHLVTVVDTRGFTGSIAEPEFFPMDFLQDYMKETETKLTELTFEGMQHCGKIVREVFSGTPYTEIIKYVDKSGIDLIVMGTHGYTGIKHLLIGSVAENVVRRAPCPVLTVRPDTRGP